MKKMSEEELKEAIRGMEYDPSRKRYIGDDGSELVVKPDSDGKGYRLDYYDSTTYGNAPHNSIHVVADTDENWKKTVNDRDNGTQEKSSGSGCYLTTACMKWKQDDFDDNCYELFILRWFRDNFVPKQDINHYYEIAPKIVEEIEKDPECDIVYNYIYETVIVPCVKAIRYGDFAFAYSRYKNSILALEETYAVPNLNQNSNKVFTLNTITA